MDISQVTTEITQLQTLLLDKVRSLAEADRDIARAQTGLPLEFLEMLVEHGVHGIMRLTEAQVLPMKLHLSHTAIRRVMEGASGADWIAGSEALDQMNKMRSRQA
jgi:hypothetical protein